MSCLPFWTQEPPMHPKRTETLRLAGVSRLAQNRRLAQGAVSVPTRHPADTVVDLAALLRLPELLHWLRQSFLIYRKQWQRAKQVACLWVEKPMGRKAEPTSFPVRESSRREPVLDALSVPRACNPLPNSMPVGAIMPEEELSLPVSPARFVTAMATESAVVPTEAGLPRATGTPLSARMADKKSPASRGESVLRPEVRLPRDPIFLMPENRGKAAIPSAAVAERRAVTPVSEEDLPGEERLSPHQEEHPPWKGTLERVLPAEPTAEWPALPPFSLMVDPGPKKPGGPSREDLNLIARTLEQKLADFHIKGQIVDVLPGPVVTTFELDPAPGLRSAKVIGLADDLARSISVSSVRVVGNVPGKTVIGIEIPNEVRQTVYLKEVLTSEAFRRMAHPLAVALGSDIFGNPVAGNLAKMPHLLVAGTTGSGKSVAVNAMICSILFSARPDEVRFLMVDPKMLELSIYEGIPHLLAPVVTDVHKAANLLKWAVSEMENRYRLMSELGVRNLAGYNERIAHCIEHDEQPTRRVKVGMDPETGRPVERDEPIPLDSKPLIVIVIDELADLMIQVGKEVEPAIARLAQMARAAGLHLILATQRPSVDVITGLIKANFPTRLAFQVSSKIDSRTILDAMGADRLLGMGDGLFLPPGTSHLQRIHAPFVSDKEVHDLVKYLRSTGTPDYDLSVLIQRGEGEDGEESGFMGGAGGEAQDELYDQAVHIVLRERKVSTSMVQRIFKIGYNRAARIVEQMENEGVVSAPNGAGKREVLAPEG
ncbi:MAG: cell division protein FtsK [Magnetococcales bacterium]|nr:cell division protein FtsK [Magnetococcales bacterium]